MATTAPIKEGLELPHVPPPPPQGRTSYSVEVDSENKAKTLRIFHIWGQPHVVAFHLMWTAFFIVFLGTFAPAALVGPIRQNLNLTKAQIGNAGVAAVCSAIFGRIFLGTVLDVVGPRITSAGILLLIAPACFCMALVENFSAFAAVRFFIGISLAMFVCCSFWVGSMFNVKIVGTANAIAAGWGNMGGGATHFVLPLLYANIKSSGVPGYSAWRWAFFLPGGMFMLSGLCCLLFGVDHPSGVDYRTLKARGEMKSKGAFWPTLKVAIFNYRTWILCLTYGYCFGVELTVDNMITGYMYDHFPMSYSTAGALGSIFGMMNLFTRASGGMISDICNKYWGMRGRLWSLWIIQTLGGVFCLAMGYCSDSLTATLVTMIIFSIFCQQACGLHYGIVPFVSRRSYGVVAGIVGAGGNVGAAVTQGLFFAGTANWQLELPQQDGLVYMGIMILVLTLPLVLIHFPMWGGMLTKPTEGATEEDYYLKEWSAEEVAAGLHHGSMRFAMESRSQRGVKAHRALEHSLSANNMGKLSVDQSSVASSDHPNGNSGSPAAPAPAPIPANTA